MAHASKARNNPTIQLSGHLDGEFFFSGTVFLTDSSVSNRLTIRSGKIIVQGSLLGGGTVVLDAEDSILCTHSCRIDLRQHVEMRSRGELLVQQGGQIFSGGAEELSGTVSIHGKHVQMDGIIEVYASEGEVEMAYSLLSSVGAPQECVRTRHVSLLGETIIQGYGAEINAPGGTIVIGGGFAGKGSVVRAKDTYLHAGVKINVDGVGRKQDAGCVSVWGEDSVMFQGSISACGSPLGGNGGFVEVRIIPN